MPQTKETLLSHYAVPDFLVRDMALDIDIQATHARVTSRMNLRRNPKGKKNAPLFLNGENQRVMSVTLNDKALSKKDYKLTPKGVTISGMPDKAVLEIASTHDPYKNTAL